MSKDSKTDTKKVRTSPVILLIEDDGLIIRMYSKKLEMDGYEVITANNGEEGLKLIKEVSPDLVLCDVMMPVMNGFELLEVVKSDNKLKDTSFVMLTNLSDEDQAERAIELGALTYLVKSEILPADVVSKVKELLKATGAESVPHGVAVN